MKAAILSIAILTFSGSAEGAPQIPFTEGLRLSGEIVLQLGPADCTNGCTYILEISERLNLLLHVDAGGTIYASVPIDDSGMKAFQGTTGYRAVPTPVDVIVLATEGGRPCLGNCWVDLGFSSVRGKARIHLDPTGIPVLRPRQAKKGPDASTCPSYPTVQLIPTDPDEGGAWGTWQAPPENQNDYEWDPVTSGDTGTYRFYTWWLWSKRCVEWECEDHIYPTGEFIRVCRKRYDNCM